MSIHSHINNGCFSNAKGELSSCDRVHRAHKANRTVQPFGISGLHLEDECLGPHIKCIATRNHKKNLKICPGWCGSVD